MTDEQKMLSPKTDTVHIGVRKVRKITLFQLSLADQFAFADTIGKALGEFSKWAEEDKGIETVKTADFVLAVTGVVQRNLDDVMKMITDTEPIEGGTFASELSNEQLSEVLTKIWEMNYEATAKNLQDLRVRIQNKMGVVETLEPSRRSLQR